MRYPFPLRFLSVLVAVLALSACAGAPVIYDLKPKTTVGSLGSDASVVIEDRRPEDDKNHSVGSFLIGSSNYGIWTLGDQSFAPAPLDALRLSILQAAAATRPAPKQIHVTVERLIVQDNQQAAHLSDGSASLGPLGVLIAESIHGQEFERDFTKTKPFVIALFKGKVTMNGKTREVTVAKANNYKHPVDVAGRRVATQKTMEDFLQATGTAIAKP